MSSAFVIWQDPETTMWEPVAKLAEAHGVYSFSYTQGALNKNFVPFPRMNILDKVYESTELFPFFQNRLIPERRPEYLTMLSWLDMVPGANDPLEILSASGGSRKTDNFRIIKVPQMSASKEYRLKFFLSGIAYISDDAKRELLTLDSRTRLSCIIEEGNRADSNAISVINPGTGHHLGYYPHYLNEDLIYVNRKLGVAGGQLITSIPVLKVNLSAPEQYRLLCESVTPWPDNFVPFQSEKYKLLATKKRFPSHRE
ncbi:hypothetical protein V0M98_01280 [Pseudomonas silesiensis]|uniref:hypothetical protein n=1 Tax=Pseudomonas silesiensis TaxID=1853130 RepID=UPI0030D1768A